MSISSSRTFEILLGTSTPAEDTRYLLGTGSAGTAGAKRRLVHPDSANWPPITYQRNPDETSNVHNDAIMVPISGTVLTQGSTRVQRFARTIEDVIVTERWFGGDNRASVETWFLDLLLEYVMNPPEIDPVSQTYVVWEPRDLNDFAYNVEIVDILSGGVSGQIWVKDLVPPSGYIGGGMQTSDVPSSGVNLKPIDLILKLVSKVS